MKLIGEIKGYSASCQNRIKKGSPPICSVSSPDRGTSNRICYGVGTDRILLNPGLGPFWGTGKKPLIPPTGYMDPIKPILCAN